MQIIVTYELARFELIIKKMFLDFEQSAELVMGTYLFEDHIYRLH
jgi:hypothetical protein